METCPIIEAVAHLDTGALGAAHARPPNIEGPPNSEGSCRPKKIF